MCIPHAFITYLTFSDFFTYFMATKVEFFQIVANFQKFFNIFIENPYISGPTHFKSMLFKVQLLSCNKLPKRFQFSSPTFSLGKDMGVS